MLRIVSLTPLTDVLVLSMVLYSRFMIRFFKSLFGRCLKGLLKTCFSLTDGLVFCLSYQYVDYTFSQDLSISYEQSFASVVQIVLFNLDLYVYLVYFRLMVIPFIGLRITLSFMWADRYVKFYQYHNLYQFILGTRKVVQF